MTGKPQSHPVQWDAGFWESARNGQLTIQRCDDCGRLQTYPRPVCLTCFGSNLGWAPSTGAGRIYSFTVVRAPLDASFKEEVPIYLADVTLHEGVRLLARLADADPSGLEIDAEVVVEMRPDSPDGMPVPFARLVRGAPA
jgi:uncharacterized OB-fold protein